MENPIVATLARALQVTCALLPFVCFQARAAAVPILGVGATTPCSTWTWARGHQPAANDLQNWALGYISGEEAANSDNFLTGTDARTLFSALDTECLIEPNVSVADAVGILARKIKEGI